MQVLQEDPTVGRVMANVVGASRWSSALQNMRSILCSAGTDTDAGDIYGDGSGEQDAAASVDKDVTWGEFLLCFIPR